LCPTDFGWADVGPQESRFLRSPEHGPHPHVARSHVKGTPAARSGTLSFLRWRKKRSSATPGRKQCGSAAFIARPSRARRLDPTKSLGGLIVVAARAPRAPRTRDAYGIVDRPACRSRTLHRSAGLVRRRQRSSDAAPGLSTSCWETPEVACP